MKQEISVNQPINPVQNDQPIWVDIALSWAVVLGAYLVGRLFGRGDY
jgi:hypothetical protein